MSTVALRFVSSLSILVMATLALQELLDREQIDRMARLLSSAEFQAALASWEPFRLGFSRAFPTGLPVLQNLLGLTLALAVGSATAGVLGPSRTQLPARIRRPSVRRPRRPH